MAVFGVRPLVPPAPLTMCGNAVGSNAFAHVVILLEGLERGRGVWGWWDLAGDVREREERWGEWNVNSLLAFLQTGRASAGRARRSLWPPPGGCCFVSSSFSLSLAPTPPPNPDTHRDTHTHSIFITPSTTHRKKNKKLRAWGRVHLQTTWGSYLRARPSCDGGVLLLLLKPRLRRRTRGARKSMKTPRGS